jgi:hypothetical protein
MSFWPDGNSRGWCGRLIRTIAGVSLAGVLGIANAYTLGLTPSSGQVAIGEEFSVAVTASDVLPDGLGSYSLDVTFSEGVLGFNRVVDGFGLGANAFGLFYALSGNVLTFTDASFDDVSTLLASQGPSFTLFTLYFDAVGTGSSSLTLSSITLADAYGNEGSFVAQDASVNVSDVSSAIPEPGTLPLMAFGGVLLLWVRRRMAGDRSN